jgi:cell division protein FtsB
LSRALAIDEIERVPRVRRGRRLIWPVLVSVVFVGVLFVGVFPTQTYLDQRDEAERLRAELAEIEARNEELATQVEALQDPEAVELIAREEFGLVYPGEEAYAIVPGGDEAVEVPNAWPFEQLEERLDN